MPIMNANYEVGGGLTPASIVNLIYPVGSIYMSVNNTSPATLFGGTWVKLEDRFLIGASSSYANGSTGGEATHTLSVDEMPSHTHTFIGTNVSGTLKSTSVHQLSCGGFAEATGCISVSNYSGMRRSGGTDSNDGFKDLSINFTPSGSISSSGAGAAHNNMPPYLAVNMWKRTA